MSRGKNSVSSALGSNVRFKTASPDAVRTAAVKPAPVNSLKRSSNATAGSVIDLHPTFLATKHPHGHQLFSNY
jgi:hypothetical protein